MLVLTRKREEEIYIGEDIVITVGDIANGRVRLGIEAPDTTRVERAEVRERRMARIDTDLPDED